MDMARNSRLLDATLWHTWKISSSTKFCLIHKFSIELYVPTHKHTSVHKHIHVNCSFTFCISVKNVRHLLVWRVHALKTLKSLHLHNGMEIMQQSREDWTLRLVEVNREDGQLGGIMEISGYRWLLAVNLVLTTGLKT